MRGPDWPDPPDPGAAPHPNARPKHRARSARRPPGARCPPTGPWPHRSRSVRGSRSGVVASSRRSCASCAVSLSRWLLTDTYSPSAIDTAPATRPASPAVKMGPRAVVAPATPITRPATETIPSLAPSTPARNQFSRPARPAACGSLGWGAARRFLTVAGAADGTGEPSLMPQVNQREWTACRGAQADFSLGVAEPTRADRVAVAVAGQRAWGTPSIPLSSWSYRRCAPVPAPAAETRCRTAARTEASEQVREAAGGDVAGEDDEQVGERPGEGLRSGPAGETTAAAGAGDGRHGERQHHRH